MGTRHVIVSQDDDPDADTDGAVVEGATDVRTGDQTDKAEIYIHNVILPGVIAVVLEAAPTPALVPVETDIV